jgi:hypothetical protein
MRSYSTVDILLNKLTVVLMYDHVHLKIVLYRKLLSDREFIIIWVFPIKIVEIIMKY